MIQVGLLTIEQKNMLVDQFYSADSYFYPIQDVNDNWIISQEEMNGCIFPDFDWVKDLTLITFEPKPDPNPL